MINRRVQSPGPSWQHYDSVDYTEPSEDTEDEEGEGALLAFVSVLTC